MPGTLPPEFRPGGPGIPPGIAIPADDPTQRIRKTLREARRAALEAEEDEPAYVPDPMRNIEYDLPHHPGFFDKDRRMQYDEMHVGLVLDGACDNRLNLHKYRQHPSPKGHRNRNLRLDRNLYWCLHLRSHLRRNPDGCNGLPRHPSLNRRHLH